jgi:hypothetical protein
MMPHVNMMRAIQTRAPNLLSARLLGTSKKKYPMGIPVMADRHSS